MLSFLKAKNMKVKIFSLFPLNYSANIKYSSIIFQSSVMINDKMKVKQY